MVSIRSDRVLSADWDRKNLVEAEGIFEEPVTIKRFQSITVGDSAMGKTDTQNFQLVKTTAVISALDPKELSYPNSIYAEGDVHADFKVQVFGGESENGENAGSRPSDRVVYNNREYRIVGHPYKVYESGVWYWRTTLRQV